MDDGESYHSAPIQMMMIGSCLKNEACCGRIYHGRQTELVDEVLDDGRSMALVSLP
jgi:hypothetical protein